jgi:3-oxoacyl-ACP reductase-like protein
MTSTPAAATEAPSTAAAAAAASTRLFDDPLDDPELYRTFDELLNALQDMGTKVTKGKSAGEMRYNELTRAVSNTQKTLLLKYKHFGIPKNPTECKRQIASHCIRIRKEQDVVNLPV